MKMRVLLTGIPGWLASRFLEILVEGFDADGPVNDWKIRCLKIGGVDGPFIERLSKIGKIEFVTGDVTKVETLRDAVRDIDLVFHMAGVVHPRRVSQFFKVNTLGTENLLKASTDAGVKRFIYISSNSVGGINKNRSLLMKEDDYPMPYMSYGLSKHEAERVVKSFQETGRIETVVLRACWFYGPRQPLRYTQLFRMIKKGRPFIFGNGENLRSMTYLDNVCSAMLLASENRLANGRTYWIADSRPYTCYEIYKTIAELLDVVNFDPIYLPVSFSDFFSLTDKVIQKTGLYVKEIHVAGEMGKDIACSIEKARKELAYEPRVSLKEGMQRSIEWCRKNNIAI